MFARLSTEGERVYRSVNGVDWTPFEDLRLGHGDTVYAADGPTPVVRRGALALHYPTPDTPNGVDRLSLHLLTKITTVAFLPSLGEGLGLIAAATAVLPGETKPTAILLRYYDTGEEDPWRPYAILDGFTEISQLAEYQGGVFFAGKEGWGVYTPKAGMCVGDQTLTDITNVVALADGSFYLQGQHAPEGAVAAWLVPR